MARSLFVDLRRRVVDAVEGGLSCRAAAERFGVSASSAIRWRAQERREGDLRPKLQGGDRHSQRIEAQAYFVTDGQKDIAACFDRMSSSVVAALKYDREGNSQDLHQCWQQGGTLKIYPDPKTGKFDYRGTKGQKIEWEMVPMGELFVEEGTIPGDSPHTLTCADGTIWHPTGRWAATVVRLCGGICILDAENNFNPVAFLQFNKDSPDQYPVKRIDDDHWEIVFDKIHSPGHEIGFSPDWRYLCMMNNLRENSCAVFNVRDPDPTSWKKIAHIEDPLWGGKYPNPFHMVFSLDSSKLYLSMLHPSPAASGVMRVTMRACAATGRHSSRTNCPASS